LEGRRERKWRSLSCQLANSVKTKRAWWPWGPRLREIWESAAIALAGQDWTDPTKPWASMDLSCKPADRLLFNASTIITVGDGTKAQLWHRSWLDGEAPKNLAPHLFKLVKRENRMVQQELHNNSWIRLLRGRITTATHLEEFVSLWLRVQNIQLQPGIRDSIVWSPDGIYPTRSAYRIQFQGSYRRFRSDLIWKAYTENKCKVFA